MTAVATIGNQFELETIRLASIPTIFAKVLDQSRNPRHSSGVSSTPDFPAQLRDAELRVTRPRVAVLEALHARPHAPTDSIFDAVRAVLPGVSRQAVYDVLHALTSVGIVRRIQPSGSVALYELRVGDNHHHVVCRSCRTVSDVDCAVGEAPCLTPPDYDGFEFVEVEVVFWGMCPDCVASQSSRSHP